MARGAVRIALSWTDGPNPPALSRPAGLTETSQKEEQVATFSAPSSRLRLGLSTNDWFQVGAAPTGRWQPCAAQTKRPRSSCPESSNSSRWKSSGGDQYPSGRSNKYIYHTLLLVPLRHHSLLQLIGGRDTQVQATIRRSFITQVLSSGGGAGGGSCDSRIVPFIGQEDKQPLLLL